MLSMLAGFHPGGGLHDRAKLVSVVYVATKNAGKFRELAEIFDCAGWQLATFPAYRDVDEGDQSYAANAALKARALRLQLLGAGIVAPVIGDDSGLEVSALAGRPGVLSARYGGESASWPERRSLLLAEVARQSGGDRSARFVCALHFIASDGCETSVVRTYPGSLAERERGSGGFSYDSIFESPAHDRTFAELDGREKNRVSHRARAAAALLSALATRPEITITNGKSGTTGT